MTWATWVGSIGVALAGVASVWTCLQQRAINRHERQIKKLTDKVCDD